VLKTKLMQPGSVGRGAGLCQDASRCTKMERIKSDEAAIAISAARVIDAGLAR
jgi:hypothetical protein